MAANKDGVEMKKFLYCDEERSDDLRRAPGFDRGVVLGV